MWGFRKSSLPIRQQIGNIFKRKGRKNGRTENANFDFWIVKDEEDLLISATSSSATSSYYSSASLPHQKKEKIYEKQNINSGVKTVKIFLYILPFIILPCLYILYKYREI